MKEFNFSELYLIGEVRQPNIKQAQDKPQMYCTFNLELSSGFSQRFYVTENIIKKDGTVLEVKVFEKVKNLRHGQKCILKVSISGSEYEDKEYVNIRVMDVFEYTSELERAMKNAGIISK